MAKLSAYSRIDIPNLDVWDFLFSRDGKPYPDNKVVLVDAYTNRSYTFGRVRDIAIRFGQGLISEYGWQRGDVLAIYAPNSIDYPPVLWGCHWAGGTVSTANPTYTSRELAFQLTDSKVKLLITEKKLLATAQSAAREAGLPKNRIILIGDEEDNSGVFRHFRSLKREGSSRMVTLDPKTDLAYLVYSSGTTGKPKGVMLTHTNIVSNILMVNACAAGQLTPRDRAIAFLPYFHSYGLTVVMHQAFYLGLESIVMPRFDLEKWCSVVQERQVTFANVVPPVVLLLGKSDVVSKYDLSSLRMMNSGAAPLTKELVHVVHRRLKLKIKQGYGLSETSPVTHEQQWHEWDKAIGSVGRLLPNQEAKIVSPDGDTLPTGMAGEMWVKGPNVFPGYLNNPTGTKNALTEDSWFKTGDVGYCDDDGFFFITDRIKELIKYNAYQVAPAELEGLLMSHPMVSDVAVVGVQDDSLATEVPRAYVVPAVGVQGDQATAADIMDWLKKRVANHKRLRGGIRFCLAIPKTVSGKILRDPLRLMANEERRRPRARL